MSDQSPRLSDQDLNEILKHAEESFLSLANKRIFLTGATGFFGKWLTQSLILANSHYNLNLQLTILTRSIDRALTQLPWLDCDFIKFVEGDVRNFTFPDKKFDIVFNGAVAASEKLNKERPDEMLQTCVQGSERTWEFAKVCGAKTYMLTSSGAVYGAQPSDTVHVKETFMGGPNPLDPLRSYHEGKRVSEIMGSIMAKQTGIEFKVARFFAFIGPYLSLDTHFAIGNFISDCLKDRTVLIKGDGTNHRSLLYGVDLVVWLLRVLTHGESCRAYNVGSDVSITIAEMANIVDEVGSETLDRDKLEDERVKVYKKPDPLLPVERYVPSVNRIQSELGVEISVDLEDALRRTFAWYQKHY